MFFITVRRALVANHLERGRMPLHDVVGVNCKTGAITNIKVQVPRILAMG